LLTGAMADPFVTDKRCAAADQRSAGLRGHPDNRDMRHGRQSTVTHSGFTLIELLIAVAIATILLTIAVPAYQDSVRKSRRADAVTGLMQLQQLEERHRANNPAYATTIVSAPTTSPEKHYALTIPAAAASTYTITATAQASSPQFGDTRCRSLSIKMDGGTMSTESTNASGTVDTTNANRCWAK
jgi:type IV pilus assembly protein PilE